MSALTFFAYRNCYSDHIYVKPGDVVDELEALNSPSVVAVVRGIEAGSLAEAEGIARREFAAGHFTETHAAARHKQGGAR